MITRGTESLADCRSLVTVTLPRRLGAAAPPIVTIRYSRPWYFSRGSTTPLNHAAGSSHLFILVDGFELARRAPVEAGTDHPHWTRRV